MLHCVYMYISYFYQFVTLNRLCLRYRIFLIAVIEEKLIALQSAMDFDFREIDFYASFLMTLSMGVNAFNMPWVSSALLTY